MPLIPPQAGPQWDMEPMPVSPITITAHSSLLGPGAVSCRMKGKLSLGSLPRLHYERFEEMVSEVCELEIVMLRFCESM